MINTQTLARPYAKAAFEVASAAGRADAWSAMLNLAAVAVEVPEVAALLNDPRLTRESKVEALVRLFGSDIDEAFRNFVLTLGENDRLAVLRPCASCSRSSRPSPKKNARCAGGNRVRA